MNPSATIRSEPSEPRPPLRVVIVDDVEIVRAGVQTMLLPHSGLQVVAAADPAAIDGDIDLALFDWFTRSDAFPHGVDVLLEHPRLRNVAIYTWWSTPGLIEVAARKGVAGYLSKRLTASHLVSAIERVIAAPEMLVVSAAGDGDERLITPGAGSMLTQRESQVLAMLIEGKSNRDIAAALFVSIDTVKTHLRAVYRKLGVANRTHAVVRALESEF
jgi:DNA-binding NarL/FixJ family response regulator